MHKHSQPRTERSLHTTTHASLYQALPRARRRTLRGTLVFLGATLGTFALLSIYAKAHAAGGAYVVDDGEQKHRLTWGTGMEYDLAPALTLVAERFGQEGGDQGWQAGPRLHIGQKLDIDLVAGGQLNGDQDHWFTTGATLRF